jgi:hypothetical protein
MATSGTYAFQPSIGEVTLFAYQLAGVRPTALTTEHFQTARMSANMLLTTWANRGVNLWAVDKFTFPLVVGTQDYTLNPQVVSILDAYVTTATGQDRMISSISRTEFVQIPTKTTAETPVNYWIQHEITPIITLYPVPNAVLTLTYYALRQTQDAALSDGQNAELPYRYLEAFAHGLAWRVAAIWNPERAEKLKLLADESYNFASSNDVENVNIYITPMLSGYFRQ